MPGGEWAHVDFTRPAKKHSVGAQRDGRRPVRSPWTAYVWSVIGVASATGLFWLARGYVDKGQASLLFLPIVIAIAVRYGFGPAICAALLSFLSWDFFFLPPYNTFVVADYRDWLSLIVFLLAAVTTARLASNAREQARQAAQREEDIATLYQASDAVSREVEADRLLPALAKQLVQLCDSPSCIIFRAAGDYGLTNMPFQGVQADSQSSSASFASQVPAIERVAELALTHDDAIGFGTSADLWMKAFAESDLPPETDLTAIAGAYVPLRAQGVRMGVLFVAPRRDGVPFSALDERLIRTLANHAAVVLARQELASKAAQAEALKEADSLKDRILSLTSHELRTPLASIKASASGLLQAGAHFDEAERREALNSISSEVDRLAHLVSNMLDLSRLEAGSWQPQKDWCDMREVIGTALDRFDDTDAGRVFVAASAEIPMVRADYTQIALAVTNLLGNAVKYGPPAAMIDITCKVVTSDVDGIRSLMTCVRDHGDGITPEDAERIFERFYRSARHAKGPIHGTGLGLSLCQAIVQAHGGRIWAANAQGGGAVFCFTLPLEDPAG